MALPPRTTNANNTAISASPAINPDDSNTPVLVARVTAAGVAPLDASVRESIHAIIDRWIEHAEAATGTLYSAEWMGGWDAYVIPYWNGERVGFYAIHGNDDGNGSIPFDQIIDALSLDFTVAWSDGTTDGDSE